MSEVSVLILVVMDDALAPKVGILRKKRTYQS